MSATTHKKILRSPVIVVMGHIDHGKSTLLDYIRKSNSVEGEAGGITQHISAYEVAHTDKSGALRKITFLDTPGHEAFQKMRDHGAEVADIAILMVSAEDGVKAQTLEALASIKRAGIPFIVAINKIDKPNANPDRSKQELLEHGVYLEGLGGDIPSVLISAKRGDGVTELIEMTLLVADLAELTGDPERPAEGVIIETNRDPKKGISATLIIKNGTLRQGDFVLSGASHSPVRIFEDFLGKTITEASFSSPVRVVGWSDLPEAGATFSTCATKKEAERQATEVREARQKASTVAIGDGDRADVLIIPLILKADVSGSLDAVEHEIKKLHSEGIELRIVFRGVGSISETDVKTALGSTDTLVVGFNTNVDDIARDLAERNGVEIKTFEVIYKLSEWLGEIIDVRRPKMSVEEVAGRAKVLKTFSHTKRKQVLGGRLEAGVLALNSTVRIMRSDTEIGRGSILNLQQNRADMKKVEQGEFGAEVRAGITIAPGDYLETFVVKVK
jgi:translation initiation factor IF-2